METHVPPSGGVAGAPVCASQEEASNQWSSASVMTARGAGSPNASSSARHRSPGTRSPTAFSSPPLDGPTGRDTQRSTLGSWLSCSASTAGLCPTRARTTRSVAPRSGISYRPGPGRLALSCPLTSSRRGRVRPYRADSIRAGEHIPQVRPAHTGRVVTWTMTCGKVRSLTSLSALPDVEAGPVRPVPHRPCDHGRHPSRARHRVPGAHGCTGRHRPRYGGWSFHASGGRSHGGV